MSGRSAAIAAARGVEAVAVAAVAVAAIGRAAATFAVAARASCSALARPSMLDAVPRLQGPGVDAVKSLLGGIEGLGSFWRGLVLGCGMVKRRR